jgi:hypothetical protein
MYFRRAGSLLLALTVVAVSTNRSVAPPATAAPIPAESVPTATAKPPLPVRSFSPDVACNLEIVTHDWQLAQLYHNFQEYRCDSSGLEVWQYGTAHNIPDAPEGVWGTILAGSYPDQAGHGLRSTPFVVTPSTRLVEIEHYYDIENGYDGGNLLIYPYETVIEPIGGYPAQTISSSSTYYAWCVDGEPGWTGSSGGWRVDCFDLSAYMGLEVSFGLDFGSDASVTALG